MRYLQIAAAIAALCFTAACGTTEERTVVVNPPPGSTVVVPADGHAHVECSGPSC
jgi:hypothetical protein